jgi:hypothetical protein
MSSRKYFLFMAVGSALLIAALLLTVGPFRSGTAAHAATQSVPKPTAATFANNNWNCLTAACTRRVKAGQAQPNYECAEFVSRSLAFAGFIPRLGSTSSQSAYGKYKFKGKTYDLLLITPTAGLHTLADFLLASGDATNIGHNLTKAVAGDVVVFDTHGIPEHTVLIVARGKTTAAIKVDSHNNARHNLPLNDEISGFTSWFILHIK